MDRRVVEPISAGRRSLRRRARAARHLSVQEAVSYIDRSASARTLAQLEHHLARCDACLREVIEVALFLHHREGAPDGAGSEG